MAKTSALPLETVVKTSAPPTPEVTAAGTLLPPLTAAFNDVARSSLPPVTLGFALFHFFLAVAYGVFLPPEIIPTVVPLVGGTAVLLLLLYGLVRTWGLPAHWAQPMGAGIAAVSVCSVLIHLSISMEPRQTGIITFLLTCFKPDCNSYILTNCPSFSRVRPFGVKAINSHPRRLAMR